VTRNTGAYVGREHRPKLFEAFDITTARATQSCCSGRKGYVFAGIPSANAKKSEKTYYKVPSMLLCPRFRAVSRPGPFERERVSRRVTSPRIG
jgi:hypothetical protein